MLLPALLAVVGISVVLAFDNSRYDNTVVYWGQNSYGAAHLNDTANYQQRLSFYCNDDAIDVFPLAFLNVFFGTGDLPSMNLANTCNTVDNTTFPGTALPDCSLLATDIATCQAKGKIVTLSLGGATGSVGFSSDAQAVQFANTVWNLFLGGTSDARPFGSAILDGVDLDIEGGTSSSYPAFVNELRALATGASKRYYITAAPQCVFPDAALSGVLNAASFDAIYGSRYFYNNPCGLTNFGKASNWNFGIWDQWARNTSLNPDVKVYIGAPASSTAAGSGYVDIGTLSSIAVQMRNSFPSFGGVMLWDASQAYANDRYDLTIKGALAAAGGVGFTYPACSATNYSAGSVYIASSTVSYNGYIWEAKWWTQSVPASNPNGDWSAISACSGSGSNGGDPTTTTMTTTSAWKHPYLWRSLTYLEPESIVYSAKLTDTTNSSHLWTAKWWTQGDTPEGSVGVWVDQGACVSSRKVTAAPKPTSTGARGSGHFSRDDAL
ncbi:glycoside hydrolase family 18 protein [Desarmillaria tabescens]|uniref:chitinase n=1 Tax=Armillaria tabescens TaxID=1929756 RepID=A0AA39NGM4_ARMTA|nr:glycoside hydrolase family 18 protein [Desarmillaria tabescens]KAK0465287.1 glycoside hydrolase family 18 protein [Desarmillaria tabescens]